MSLAPDDYDDWVECWQCGGNGMLAGCFEDTCCGADCDPEDPDYCCASSRCDVCRGQGGWNPDKPAALATARQQEG